MSFSHFCSVLVIVYAAKARKWVTYLRAQLIIVVLSTDSVQTEPLEHLRLN